MKKIDIYDHYLNHFSPKPLWKLNLKEFEKLSLKVARYIRLEKAFEDIND